MIKHQKTKTKMKTIKAKVHRLPTDRAEKCVTIAHKQMMLSPGLVTSGGDIQAYHLYITTDERPKLGEWCLSNGDIFQATKEMVDKMMPDGYTLGMYPKKIIATTDPKLHTNEIVEEDMHMYKKSLPQIPQSFIEEYCKAGGIDKVLVEYEEYIKCTNCNLTEEDCECNVSYTQDLIGIDRVKLNPDNTIIIHPVEEKMYSREEILSFARYVAKVGFGLNHVESLFDKWIEENL